MPSTEESSGSDVRDSRPKRRSRLGSRRRGRCRTCCHSGGSDDPAPEYEAAPDYDH